MSLLPSDSPPEPPPAKSDIEPASPPVPIEAPAPSPAKLFALRSAAWGRREAPYLVMFLLLAVFSLMSPGTEEEPEPTDQGSKAAGILPEVEMFSDLQQLRQLWSRDPEMAVALISLAGLICFAMLAGTAILLWWGISALLDKDFFSSGWWPPRRWGLWDVFKTLGLYFYLCTVTRSILQILSLSLPVRDFVNGLSLIEQNLLIQLPASILICPFILYLIRVEKGQCLHELGFHPRLKDMGVGVLGYLGVLPLVAVSTLLSLVVVRVFNLPQEGHPISTEILKTQAPWAIATMVLFACVIAPVWEELFFRGLFYPVMRRWTGAYLAMGVSAFVFSFMHANVLQFLPIFVLGLLLAYLYEKTQSLSSAITAHALFNTGSMVALMVMRSVTDR